MATNGTSGQHSSFPPVELDKTLYDMLRAEVKEGEIIESICQVKSNSDVKYGKTVPLSDKYIIHAAQVGTPEDLAHLQLEICTYLLNFYAGPMNVILFGAEGETDDKTLYKPEVEKNAIRSFSVINEKQRPRLQTYKNLEDCVANHDGAPIRWAFGMDFCERLPNVFHPELTYLLNSKRWLAECDLKSANDRILDCEVACSKHQVKTDRGNMWYHDRECRDCASGMEADSQRVLNIIQKRNLPFVLKLTQSLSSVGTILVDSEDDRKEALKTIEEYLQTYVPRITKENAYLMTTALILSDKIPGKTNALNMFVRRDGTVEYIGACHQLATGNTGRQNTAITYADQDKLEKQFHKTLVRIGKTLHEHGYYGPCGADIMEDDSGAQYVIDLNVRTALSLLLYLLRTHFTSRGYGMALVYECVMLSISREEVEERFKKEFEEARIILLGATKFGDKQEWGYGLVLAGEDKEACDKLSDRFLEFEI